MLEWKISRLARGAIFSPGFFNNKFKVFGMGMVLFAGEFYVNDFAIDGFRCICYKILTSEFCMDLRAVLGTI